MLNAFFFILLAFAVQPLAAELSIKITDTEQNPLPYTVIELVNSQYPATADAELAQVVQQGLTFQPFVSVIRQGTAVEFPNLDKTRHHVYSFSKAKTFELHLYAGKPKAPVVFDQAGIVTLGCNIHDTMLAYLYVSASRYSAVTDANGEAKFTDLPATDFQLSLWHPWQQQPAPTQQLKLTNDSIKTLDIKLDIKQQPLPKAPKRGFGDN
ncbi:methylamine utilization protein [Rheinheimera pleomorphica]|uniref:methylamine utilization protein n=1 Tax=Rheinheimera pleomorphica TaxID=2703963 RepID=UPI001F50A16B|nr:methylamine utilization protein [Rheinheimera pleomorphica]